MFFEIISPTGTKSYLLGTIHINDKEIVSLPLEIKNAFDNSSTVVLEADISKINPIIVHDYLEEWMKKNHTKKIPIMFSIIQAIVILNPKRFENFFDKQLMIESQKRNKQIGFLEKAEEQIKVLMGFNFDEFEQAIYYDWMKANHRLDNENLTASLEFLKRHYLANNLDALSNHDVLPLDAPEIAYKFNKSLISDRDIIQAEAMKIFMKQGNAFFAVGAMHLLGITNKLRAESYQVTPIPLSERIYSITGNKNLSDAGTKEQINIIKKVTSFSEDLLRPYTSAISKEVIIEDVLLAQKSVDALSATQITQCEVIITELIAITQEYKNNFNCESIHEENICSILGQLIFILEDETVTPPNKIQKFYTYLGNLSRIYPTVKNIDVIKMDTSYSTTTFLKGLAVLVIALVSLPLSVPICTLYYLKTGKHLFDLFQSNSERFEKQINSLQNKYQAYAAFFQQEKQPNPPENPINLYNKSQSI